MIESIVGMGSAFDRSVNFNFINKNNRYIENGKVIFDDSVGKTFSELLSGVNDKILESDAMTNKFMLDPNSIDSHDVTIAMAEANMAISLTKSVVDGAIKAYREIINLR